MQLLYSIRVPLFYIVIFFFKQRFYFVTFKIIKSKCYLSFILNELDSLFEESNLIRSYRTVIYLDRNTLYVTPNNLDSRLVSLQIVSNVQLLRHTSFNIHIHIFKLTSVKYYNVHFNLKELEL